MPVTPLKLFASTGLAAGTHTNLASLDVPADGTLEGILFSFDGSTTGTATGHVELSFGTSSGIGINDTRSVIATFGYSCGTGSLPQMNNCYVTTHGIKLQGGERLFLNANNTAAFTTLRINVTLYFNTGASVGRTRRL